MIYISKTYACNQLVQDHHNGLEDTAHISNPQYYHDTADTDQYVHHMVHLHTHTACKWSLALKENHRIHCCIWNRKFKELYTHTHKNRPTIFLECTSQINTLYYIKSTEVCTVKKHLVYLSQWSPSYPCGQSVQI